jgi:DHA2 family multidrug resistance protein
MAWIEQLVQSQASLLSYIDVFWGFALVAALMVPLALILLRPVRDGARQGAA